MADSSENPAARTITWMDRVIAEAQQMLTALNYVVGMTYCGADAEWHFKEGYDPQIVLDAISSATAKSDGERT